jgi:hypothetical protein
MLALDKRRHELSCASCGAPLRQMKMMAQPAAPARPAVSHQPQVRQFVVASKPAKQKVIKSKKTKKRKAWFKDWAEDVFDLVEDIFD